MMTSNPFIESAPNLSIQLSKNPVANPVFSILIPTWNNLAFLKSCVASLRKNSRFQHQIILHLNEGNDGSREWAEQEGLDYTYTEVNIGICYAMNLARTLARSELLVYFNDDMYACPDWDYWLDVEVKKQSSPYFFFSSTMIEPRESGNSCVISPVDYGDHPDHLDEEKLLKNYSTPEKPDWNGATWPPSVIPTKLWDMVGGYSIEFSPGMYSDPDFSMKLWSVGVRNFKGIGKSRVYHYMSKSTAKLNSKATLNSTAKPNKKKVNGSKIFLQKWGMSSNLFTRFYLRRGHPWTGDLAEPENTISFKIKCLLSKIKRRIL